MADEAIRSPSWSALLAGCPASASAPRRGSRTYVLGAPRDYAQALGARARASCTSACGAASECGNYATETLCAICSDPRARRAAAVRGGAAAGRGRARARRQLSRPLPRAARAARAARRRGPRGARARRGCSRASQRGGVREVIVATPLSVEGEATALYLAQELRAARRALHAHRERRAARRRARVQRPDHAGPRARRPARAVGAGRRCCSPDVARALSGPAPLMRRRRAVMRRAGARGAMRTRRSGCCCSRSSR